MLIKNTAAASFGAVWTRGALAAMAAFAVAPAAALANGDEIVVVEEEVVVENEVIVDETFVSSTPSFVRIELTADYSPERLTGLSSIVFALNGDLEATGFLIRVAGAGWLYDYESAGVSFEDEGYRVAFGPGYQFNYGVFRAAFFAMAEFETREIDPTDPTSRVDGDEWGFRGLIDLETTREASWYGRVRGEFGTANETYLANTRLGLRSEYGVGGFEMVFTGETDYDEIRAGLFVDQVEFLRLNWGAAAGYAWRNGRDRDRNRDEEGAYVTLTTGVDF